MTSTKRPAKPRIRSPKGQAIIEMIFGLIMFVILLTAIAGISVYLYVQHMMVTAAREGGRIASLNEEIGDTAASAQGVTAVVDYVQGMVLSTSGITLDDDDIAVDPPDPADPIGERTVSVEIDYDLTNPVPVEQFISAFTGNSYGLGTIPIHAEATMRYEE